MKIIFDQLKKPGQQFRCFESGDKSQKLNLVVDLENTFNPSATDSVLQKLKKNVPANPEIGELYGLHNGMKLFCNGGVSGVQIYPINELESFNVEWRDRFSYYEDEDLCDYQKEGVAFGEISHSGNYFVLYKGEVYYSDHDDFNEEPLANSLADFFQQISDNPVGFLYKMGCYTRYSDGRTRKQWIPKEYCIEQ